MLDIIAGAKVETKSRWIYEQINKRVSDNSNQSIILIVPEQFTLQAEKSYLESTGKNGILNPEVLSFNRLAYRVFQETGGRSRIVIDELGKHILIRKIVQDLAGELLLYSGLANERGFIDKVVDSVTECKQYNISPDDLRFQARMTVRDGLARNKLMDLALIFETFEERLKDHFVDREDQFQALIDQMERSEFVKQSEFWIDGFFSFTPHMIRVVNKLCDCTSAVHLTAYGTADELKHSTSPLFSQTRNLMLSVMQGDSAVTITDADALSAASPQKPVLMHLSRTINQLPPKVWSKPLSGLTLFRAMNDDSEIEQVAARIMELVQDHNLRFNEISVLCAELEQRKDSIKRIFNLYGIPYFLDTKRRTVEHPLTQLISAGLETLRQGFTYHAFFRYIKTGYTGLSQDEIEMLENYVLARGIRGSMWKKSFTSEPENAETALMNQLRAKLMPPLIEFESGLAQSNSVKEMTAALFNWLQMLHVDHQISEEVKRYKQQEEYESAALTTQLWNKIITLMDQMVDIMGETAASLKDYQQLWQAGIESIEIGLIPSTIDQVMVGTPERSRQAGIKALFLMVVNDGVLPASTSETGVLLTSEKMELLQNGCLLGVFGEARQAQEELYIQLALSRPSEHLWISYSQATIEGDARRPSVLIERIKKIFPGLSERSDLFEDADAVLKRLRSPKVSYLDLASKLRELADEKTVPDYWLTLFQWFNRHDEWKEEAKKLLAALFYHNQPPLLKQNQVEKIFGQHYKGTISRLEQYNQCPFSHFIRFGLKPVKRKQHEIEIPEMGTLLHQVMDEFGKYLKDDSGHIATLSEDDHLDRIAERIVDDTLYQFNSGIFKSNARFNYQGQRLKRISLRAMKIMLFHLQNSGFQPHAFEMSFGRAEKGPDSADFEIRSADGTKVSLEGRVDRLDLLIDENTCYYRVIDYKSGKKQFSLTEVFYGLQLQLLVYLMAAMEQFNDPEVNNLLKKPAGFFYFYLDDPMIQMEKQDETNTASEIRKALKLNGLVLQDMTVIREMDRVFEKQSEIVPVGLTTAGKLSKNSSVITAEDLELLQTYVKSSIVSAASAILQGIIRAEPAQLDTWKACQYCDYQGICQYDERFTGNLPRRLCKMKEKDALEKIRESVNETKGASK